MKCCRFGSLHPDAVSLKTPTSCHLNGFISIIEIKFFRIYGLISYGSPKKPQNAILIHLDNHIIRLKCLPKHRFGFSNKLSIASFQLVTNKSSEKLSISFLAPETCLSQFSKKCQLYRFISRVDILFLRNYGFDFLHKGLNRYRNVEDSIEKSLTPALASNSCHPEKSQSLFDDLSSYSKIHKSP